MGAEFQSDNPTLNWLKHNRLAERLVSSYGWSQVSRSFDGAMAVYDNKYFNLSINGYYSHLFGDDVVQNSFRGDDGDYFYLEANFRF